MPGGTSSAGGGKNPAVSSPAQQAQDRENRGNRARSTGTDSDLLAQLMAAVRQASNQATVDQSIASQAAEPGFKFNPSDFLQAQNTLNEAWNETQDGDADELTPQERPAYFGPIPYPNGVPAGVADPSQSRAVLAAQKAYDEQLRIRRADALNVDPNGKPADMKQEIDRLNWEEYNNLTPLQQAAVDYNTMLVKAVKQDRRMQESYNPSSDTKTAYEGALEEMFGSSDKGSDTYAPATMGVLRQIGYKGDGAGDLDDFLNLDATFSAKDLKRLNQSEDLGLRRAGSGDMFANPVMDERMDLLGSLARGTQDAQSSVLEKGNAILKNFSAQAMALARADDIQRLGGVDAVVSPNNPDMAQTFDSAFNLLSDADIDAKIPGGIQTVFATIQDQMDEKQRSKFIEYVKKRLVNATNSDTGLLTDSPDVQTQRTPEELAKLLKLDGFTKGGA